MQETFAEFRERYIKRLMEVSPNQPPTWYESQCERAYQIYLQRAQAATIYP
jgi:hypothetical protein